ncbi:hypothetical protein QYF61_015324 [Mycteria americana]|uniref:Uncharacterized protein n=1 Tax=Mycteria americana TaxID=33587 RepID=A0AAN7RIL6_MYCAM|nr:hypothetical protein QYF61_015324 [Mycteria americana]
MDRLYKRAPVVASDPEVEHRRAEHAAQIAKVSGAKGPEGMHGREPNTEGKRRAERNEKVVCKPEYGKPRRQRPGSVQAACGIERAFEVSWVAERTSTGPAMSRKCDDNFACLGIVGATSAAHWLRGARAEADEGSEKVPQVTRTTASDCGISMEQREVMWDKGTVADSGKVVCKPEYGKPRRRRPGEVRRLGGVMPCTDEGSLKVRQMWASFPLNTAAFWCRQLACWVDGEVGDRPPPEDGGK